MISILIPIYNYNVVNLVTTIHLQCEQLDLQYEIIGLDDDSTNSEITKSNFKLSELFNVSIFKNSENIGNAQTRIKLSKLANYNWLLFLDADTIPIKNDFISKYLDELQQNKNINVFLGTIRYQPSNNDSLTLKLLHGNNKEVVTEATKPTSGLNLRGANFLIERKWFQSEYFLDLPQTYGYVDTVFEILLKENNAQFKLVDNPVYHLGVETTESFLLKTNKAVENAVYLEQEYPKLASHLKLVRAYRVLKKIGVAKIFRNAYNVFSPYILTNLKSKQPSLFLFQMYKLGLFSTKILS